MAPSYITIGDLKTSLEIPLGDTSRDDFLNRLIPRVSRHIDTFCHRFFYPLTATKLYDFQTIDRLWLRDDLDSLTSMVNGSGEAIDLTKIFKYPLSGPPYEWLEFNQSSTQSFRWAPTTSQQAISVTGVWGYLVDGTTPIEIEDAISAWISYLLKVGKSAGVKSKSIGDYSVSFSSVLDYLRQGPPNEAQYYLSTFVKRRSGTTSREIP